MKSIRDLIRRLFIIGGVVALLSPLHAQTTISGQSLDSASADDWAVILQAVEATTPVAAESVPRDATLYSAFYSSQFPDYPPLPGNINNIPAWNLGDGVWLLDDLDFNYQAQAQSPLMTQAMADEDGGDYINSDVFYT